MINFCDELIKVSTKPNNINFLFQTLAVSIIRKNSLWEVKTNHQRLFKSKNVILSSSLIAHPRCIDIMKINSIPLYDAFKNVKDDIVDCILRKTIKQEYLKRKNYIFHVSNLKIVNNFDQKYLHMQFSECLHEDFSFERIIFQMQRDGSMIIILHCSYISTFVDIQLEQIFQILRRIFIKEKKYLNLFDHAILLDTMDWRASQPINNLLSKELQWSSISNIGFCGDWFDFGNFSRVESAMNSSIRLAKILIYAIFHLILNIILVFKFIYSIDEPFKFLMLNL